MLSLKSNAAFQKEQSGVALVGNFLGALGVLGPDAELEVDFLGDGDGAAKALDAVESLGGDFRKAVPTLACWACLARRSKASPVMAKLKLCLLLVVFSRSRTLITTTVVPVEHLMAPLTMSCCVKVTSDLPLTRAR